MKGNRVMIAMLAAHCVPSAFAASPHVQKHGIQDYRVEETLNQKRIFLLNENNEEVGVVNVTSEPYRKIIRLTKKSGSQLLIEWALVDQKVKITDLTTGETAEAAGRKGARPQAGMPALIEKYRAEIEMVANVLQDVSLGSRRLKARRLDSLGGVSPGGGLSSTPTAKLYGDSCSGNWVRGTSTQDTRSACCQLAADNAKPDNHGRARPKHWAP